MGGRGLGGEGREERVGEGKGGMRMGTGLQTSLLQPPPSTKKKKISRVVHTDP
jgi:hypothetical protein